MRISRIVMLAAIAAVAASCSNKCEQDNAALKKQVVSLKAEIASLRTEWAKAADERDELTKRKYTIAGIVLKFSLACTSGAATVAPSRAAASVWFVSDTGTRMQFADDVARPAELAQTAKGQYELTLTYQPKDSADPIGQSISSLSTVAAIELHFRDMLKQSNLRCTSISRFGVEINGLDTLQSGSIPLDDTPAYNAAPTGDTFETVNTRQFFSGAGDAYTEISDRRVHRVR